MTDSAIHLFPPPIDISFDDEALPECSANLMPFSIAYDGPAPIDSFLVHRAAPKTSTDASTCTSAVKGEESDSFISAFRGRAIQSTPLPLPAGFVAKVVQVSQAVSVGSIDTDANGASTGDGSILDQRQTREAGDAERQKERARANKRRRIAKQPAPVLQKFSMDSDDDDEQDQHSDSAASDDDWEDTNEATESIHDASPPSETIGPSQQLVDNKAQIPGPTVHIHPIAQVQSNHLTIWGPDGPIDKGDDPFFRTVGEWYSVVAPLVSLDSSSYDRFAHHFGQWAKKPRLALLNAHRTTIICLDNDSVTRLKQGTTQTACDEATIFTVSSCNLSLWPAQCDVSVHPMMKPARI